MLNLYRILATLTLHPISPIYKVKKGIWDGKGVVCVCVCGRVRGGGQVGQLPISYILVVKKKKKKKRKKQQKKPFMSRSMNENALRNESLYQI